MKQIRTGRYNVLIVISSAVVLDFIAPVITQAIGVSNSSVVGRLLSAAVVGAGIVVVIAVLRWLEKTDGGPQA